MTMVVMEGADFYMNNMASLHWSTFKMLTYIPIIIALTGQQHNICIWNK